LRAHALEKIRGAVDRHKEGWLKARERAPEWVYGETDAIGASAVALQGLGGSPGIVEGVVFVVRGPEDFSRFPENAILVAKTTNPAWTPLFYQAKGVITESGGPLSHGTVTARELGLPAVMGVRNVCERLQNGARVRLNGGAGSVTMLEEVSARQSSCA
jgi:pyruvate,water dikinase